MTTKLSAITMVVTISIDNVPLIFKMNLVRWELNFTDFRQLTIIIYDLHDIFKFKKEYKDGIYYQYHN